MAVRGAKNKAIEAAQAMTTLETVKKLDINKVIEEVSGLQISIQDTLAKLGASITGKLQQVKQVDEAIDLKEARLKELYSIEAQVVSLDDLKAAQVQAFEDWEKETLTRQQQRELENQETTTVREREEETWQYEFDQRKVREEALLKENTASAMRAEKVRRDAVDAALKANEVTIAEAKRLTETFDARVKSEVDKQVLNAIAVQKRTYEHERALAEKDIASAKAISERESASLTAQIAALKAQNEDLGRQIIAARADAKDLASKALEATSDRRVAEALRELADGRDGQQAGGKNK